MVLIIIGYGPPWTIAAMPGALFWESPRISRLTEALRLIRLRLRGLRFPNYRWRRKQL